MVIFVLIKCASYHKYGIDLESRVCYLKRQYCTYRRVNLYWCWKKKRTVSFQFQITFVFDRERSGTYCSPIMFSYGFWLSASCYPDRLMRINHGLYMETKIGILNINVGQMDLFVHQPGCMHQGHSMLAVQLIKLMSCLMLFLKKVRLRDEISIRKDKTTLWQHQNDICRRLYMRLYILKDHQLIKRAYI